MMGRMNKHINSLNPFTNPTKQLHKPSQLWHTKLESTMKTYSHSWPIRGTLTQVLEFLVNYSTLGLGIPNKNGSESAIHSRRTL